ncbi:MAG: hypothetical protein ACRELC_03955, partial [Gemmatimonadota bacterium]
VRKAYHELEASGLAEIGPRGTRVARLAVRGGGDMPDLEAAVRAFVGRIRDEYDAGPAELRRALERLAGSRPPSSAGVCLVECSRSLSRQLARQVSDRYGIEVEAIDLYDDRSLPEGVVIGTYFHAAPLRGRLEGRVSDLHLVRIRPREALLSDLARRAARRKLRRLILMDRLPGSAADLAADFESRVGGHASVEIRILSDPLLAFPPAEPGAVVIASPQTWDRLTEELRARPDVVELRYEIEPEDLEQLAGPLQDGPPDLSSRSRVVTHGREGGPMLSDVLSVASERRRSR